MVLWPMCCGSPLFGTSGGIDGRLCASGSSSLPLPSLWGSEIRRKEYTDCGNQNKSELPEPQTELLRQGRRSVFLSKVCQGDIFSPIQVERQLGHHPKVMSKLCHTQTFAAKEVEGVLKRRDVYKRQPFPAGGNAAPPAYLKKVAGSLSLSQAIP